MFVLATVSMEEMGLRERLAVTCLRNKDPCGYLTIFYSGGLIKVRGLLLLCFRICSWQGFN